MYRILLFFVSLSLFSCIIGKSNPLSLDQSKTDLKSVRVAPHHFLPFITHSQCSNLCLDCCMEKWNSNFYSLVKRLRSMSERGTEFYNISESKSPLTVFMGCTIGKWCQILYFSCDCNYSQPSFG